MMPVTKEPLLSGQGGGRTENVVRQVVVVPFSSDRPSDRAPTITQASQTQAPQQMASTPEMQEEMRKLIDAARSAVAALQAVAPGPPAAAPPDPPPPRPPHSPPPPPPPPPP